MDVLELKRPAVAGRGNEKGPHRGGPKGYSGKRVTGVAQGRKGLHDNHPCGARPPEKGCLPRLGVQDGGSVTTIAQGGQT